MKGRYLHITNGDSTVGLIREAGFAGRFLPWRDVLHDGPVSTAKGSAALAELRARYLAETFSLGFEAVLADIRDRDATLRAWREFDGIVIWLEHDLYDQLQLLQILDALAAESLPAGFAELICIDRFPGVAPFYGLGQLTAAQLATLWESRRPVTTEQYALARDGWRAFAADTPQELWQFAQRDLAALPFLRAALYRHFEEFPALESGLTRHQAQILRLVGEGEVAPGTLFAQHQSLEEAPYLGDWSFFHMLRTLCESPRPLLSTSDGRPFLLPFEEAVSSDAFRRQRLVLTEAGKQVLNGELGSIQIGAGGLWKGGVHLSPEAAHWRWDTLHRRFVSEPAE